MSTAAKRKSYKEVNRITRDILRAFPPDLPVRIIKKKLNGYFGYVTKSKKCYYIYIDSGLTQAIYLDTAIHEIAHCLTVLDQHSIEWGKSYSRIYKYYEKHYQN